MNQERLAVAEIRSILSSNSKLDQLKDWKVELSPYVDPLDLFELYKKKHLQVPAEIQVSHNAFNFYYLPITCNIFSPKGTRVKALELAIEFDPRANKSERRPIAQDFFPQTEWKEYGKATIVFGVKSDLTFDVPLQSGGIPYVSVDAAANVSGNLVLGPFEYKFEKCEILGAGKNAYTVNWRIGKTVFLNTGDVQCHVILKVPKRISKVKALATGTVTILLPRGLRRFWKRGTKKLPLERSYDIPVPN